MTRVLIIDVFILFFDSKLEDRSPRELRNLALLRMNFLKVCEIFPFGPEFSGRKMILFLKRGRKMFDTAEARSKGNVGDGRGGIPQQQFGIF